MEKLLDVYYIRQINSFTEWLARHSRERETVFIDLPRQERSINSGAPAFIFCAPDGLAAALEKNGREDTSAWHALFRSAEYEIWEYKEKYEQGIVPLRFDLSDEEKSFALAYVRRVLDEYLETGKRAGTPMGNISDRFFESAIVDVALWVRGALRGSRIVEGMSFIDALQEAAIRSCRDERFKPLVAEELDATIIEIAIISDLHMPLLERERDANTIHTANGYCVRVRGAKGWGLPAIFNGITFKGMHDFVRYLLKRKAHVPKDWLADSVVETFAVNNFIESARTPKKALSLYGPVVRNIPGSADTMTRTIDTIATRAADYLCRIQEADGNIPPIMNPLTGKRSQVDWARLAFTAWTLAVFGSEGNSVRYRKAADKAFRYVMNMVYTHPYLDDSTRGMTLVYAYNLAEALGETGEAERIHTAILGLVPKLSYDPAHYSQIALHLLKHSEGDVALLAKAEEFSNPVLREYEQRVLSGSPLELARFVELIPILRALGNSLNDQEMIRKSKTISQWYVSQQLRDGSFPSAAGSEFAYTRGTGKIFEVLCLEPEVNKMCIEQTIRWLLDMQYDENNTYFIENDIRKESIGGFRHDFLDQSIWIDAIGHVLLGATRLTAKKESGELSPVL
jgi:AMMECR1 domain-containing protein